MKMNRRLLALIAILAALCLVLAGCGGSGNASSGNAENGSLDHAVSETESAGVVPYSAEQWVDEQLYGWYVAEGLYSEYGAYPDYTNFLEDMKYRTIQVFDSDEEVSVLPVQFKAYPVLNDTFNMNYQYQLEAFRESALDELIGLHGEDQGAEYYQNFLKFSGLNILDMQTVTPSGSGYNGVMVYRTEGNRVILSSIEYDDQTFEYTLTDEMEYSIYRDGVAIILVCEDVYVRYVPYDFCGYSDPSRIYAFGFVGDDAIAYRDIAGFSIYGDYEYDAEGAWTKVYFVNGNSAEDAYHRFNDDDTITIGWTQVRTDDGIIDDPCEFTCEYIMSCGYGLILIEDGNCHIYQTPYEVYCERTLAGLNTEYMSEDEVGALVATQKDILQALIEAFEAAGISVDIDRANGKIALDAQFLFGKNETAVSDDGKAYLDDFLGVYTSVVLSEEYADCISEIIVEGHTDNEGSYSYNMTLSEERAASVYDYCVSVNDVLADMISTKGCSYNELIYNEDGSVDMDASRRVTFRFVLKTNE